MLEQNTKQNMHPSEQSIFAWASAMGRAGVAILRLSGSHCTPIMKGLGISTLPAPRTATLISLRDTLNDNLLIDKCLCLYFPAPHSFTGEDVIELHTHGSPAIMHYLTDWFANHPLCRLAEAGEFSRRAFTNQKMDLVEAEGLADLIDAETMAQHAQALRQMSGSIGAEYDAIRNAIIHALAMMEAYIDFPDEEIPEDVARQTDEDIQTLKTSIDIILDDKGIGEKIRNGLRVAIVGAPNAGKSTFLNALAKRDVAIVSDQAGTTRDLIEVHLTLDGYPVTLIDTAGIRQAEESIEKEGIRRAKKSAEQSDIIIILTESSQLTEELHPLAEQYNALIYITKSDISIAEASQDTPSSGPLHISAKTGFGMEECIAQLKSLCAEIMQNQSHPLITRQRHRSALQNASLNLAQFLQGGDLILRTEELRCAANEIAKITGRIDVDDVLDVVFSSFCIGK